MGSERGDEGLTQQEVMLLVQDAKSLPQLVRLLRENNADSAFHEWAIRYFLDVRARERGIPFKGTFEITPFCNLDCKMCYVHLTKEQLAGKTPLSAECWERIMSEAIDAGMMYACLTGGECLTSPDFDRIYLFLHSKGVQVSVLTNGVLLDEERIRFFQQHPPMVVQITLYGECEETYERVTGYRRFETVMKNIRMAKDAGLPVVLTVTPNEYLNDSAEALVRCAASTGVQFHVNSSLMTPRAGTGRSEGFRDLVPDDYMRLFKLEQSLKGHLAPVECEVDPPVPTEDATAEAPRGLRCGGGRSSFNVTWDGRMIPCNRLQHLGIPLKPGELKSAWSQINQAVREILLPVECESCAFRKAAYPCAVMHQDNPGHAAPRQCEWCYAYVKAGLAKLSD